MSYKKLCVSQSFSGPKGARAKLLRYGNDTIATFRVFGLKRRSSSENKSRSQLYLSWLARRWYRRDVAKVAGCCAGYVRSREDRVIQRIEGFKAKLKIDLFCEVKVLHDRGIHVVEAILPHRRDRLWQRTIVERVLAVEEGRSIAGPIRWAGSGVTRDKNAGIQGGRTRSRRTGVSRTVLDIPKCIARLERNVSRKIDWRTGLELVDAVHQEAAEQLIHQLAIAEVEYLSPPERQMVCSANGEMMRVIE